MKHQEDLSKLRQDYDCSLMEIKQLHDKDKTLLESMLKKYEDRFRKGENDQSTTILEVENKYLRDIRTLNESFDAYKRQVEKHMTQLATEKALEKKQTEDAEAMIQRLKQSMRASSSHHEINIKRLKEKIAKFEADSNAVKEENQKVKAKCTHLKNQLQRY